MHHLPSEREYEQVHREILRCKAAAEESFIEFAYWLTRMRDSAVYKRHWRTFDEYLSGALHIGRREAYSIIGIYDKYIASGLLREIEPHLDRQRVLEITGWESKEGTGKTALVQLGVSKLDVLSKVVSNPHLTPQQKAEWLVRGLQTSRDDLRRQVAAAQIADKGGQVVPSCYHCVHCAIAYGGDTIGEYKVFSRGAALCHKHKILVATMTATDAEIMAGGDGERPACPDYQVGPEWPAKSA